MGACSGEATWHTAWHSTGTASCSGLVQLGHDRVGDSLQLLLLVLELVLLCGQVTEFPVQHLLGLVHDGVLVLVADLALELVVFDGLLDVEGVRLEIVLGGDALSLLVVLCLVLLGVVDHLFDVLLAETTLVVGDGDLVLLSGGLVAKMVNDAEKYKAEDDKQRERVSAKNELESYR